MGTYSMRTILGKNCASEMDKDWLTDSQSLSTYVNRIGQRLATVRGFSSYVSQSLSNSFYLIGQRLANKRKC